ncbi:LacI family DNA-binding transcriptional regulator [Paenibacillus gansuensis]|uniref:LacI family DNA-binding transcriptional regulator n=1 Tax=Paenibacillus gansuensis TaxID=306542 RepID=A0ABW5PGR7_9BACL
MATIRDVSKLAGCSVATVSRVINRKGYVHKNTEEAIKSAMKALNYSPDRIARSLAGKGSLTVGLVIPDILNPFFPQLARAIEDVASDNGYNVILCNTSNDPAKERKCLDVLISKRVDGILLASSTILPEQILELQRSAIPVVLIDHQFPEIPILSIVARNREGGAIAVRHLLEEGCRKIGHIRGPLHVAASLDRCLGYEDECGSEPWFIPSLIAQGDFHSEGGFRAMQELISRHPDIDGVFAGNDQMAIGALHALYKLGIEVPQQVKLIGFDGIASNRTVPQLSTVSQPIYTMGSQAMEYLLRLIAGETLPQQVHEFEVQLVIKETTKAEGRMAVQ